jgi:hypothetical protein
LASYNGVGRSTRFWGQESSSNISGPLILRPVLKALDPVTMIIASNNDYHNDYSGADLDAGGSVYKPEPSFQA